MKKILIVFLFLLPTCKSPQKSEVQYDMKTKDKDLSTIVFFEVDSYHGLDRFCLIASTVDEKKLRKKKILSDPKTDKIPDELVQELFEERRKFQDSFLKEDPIFDGSASPEIEDTKWEDLALHLEHGKSKAVSFGKYKKARWLNLKEFKTFAKQAYTRFALEYLSSKDLLSDARRWRRNILANMLLGAIGLPSVASFAPIAVPIYVGFGILSTGVFAYEMGKAKKTESIRKIQSEIAKYLPQSTTAQTSNESRVLESGNTVESTRTYQSLHELLSMFVENKPTETDVFKKGETKYFYEHKGVTEILQEDPPFIFSEECPSSLVETKTIGSLLTREE